MPTTTGQGGNSQSALETSSGRPKRALKRNPAYVSSSQEDDEETQQHNIDNRAREEVQKDKAATNINENPSKGSVGSLVLLWRCSSSLLCSGPFKFSGEVGFCQVIKYQINVVLTILLKITLNQVYVSKSRSTFTY